MGEIADMMLDGTLCEECGGFIGDAVGYPRKCKACDIDEPKLRAHGPNRIRVEAVCPICKSLCRDFIKHAVNKHPKRWRKVIQVAGFDPNKVDIKRP